MKLDKKQLASACSQEIAQAHGADGDELQANREKALDYYYCRPRGDEIPGRSAVISPDVSAMVEAVLSQCLDAFAADNPAEFEPLHEGDEIASQVESDVVNQVIMQDNPGYLIWQEAIKDGLLLRNGLVKVYVDETVDVTNKTFQGLTVAEVDQLMAQNRPGYTVEITSTDADADTVRVKFTATEQSLVVESVPPEDFLIQADYNSQSLEKCRFCAQKHYYTRSELLEMGYKKAEVEALPTSTMDTGAGSARNVGGYTRDMAAVTPDQDKIQVHECYIRIDVDGDGISELVRVMLAGDASSGVVLDSEEVPFAPFATGSPFINPHRWVGMSLFDKLKSSQDIKSASLRQWLDNANANNNRRMIALEGAVNMDDLLNSKPGGRIRVTQLDAVRPIEISDIGPSCQMLLDYQDRLRSEMGGAALDLASAEAQLVGSQVGSQGLDRAYSVKEQLAAMMCRNFAETLIRSTYLLVHQTLRTWYQMPIMAKVGDKWQQIQPSTWQPRSRLNVKIGLSAGERQRKSAALGQVLGYQMQIMQMGQAGVLADLSGVHNALMDWAKSAELDNPEQYFIDPASEEAQKAAQGQQQAQQQQAEEQKAMVQETLDIERGKVLADRDKTANETAWKYFDTYMDAIVEEMKLTGSASKDFQLAVLNAKAASIGSSGDTARDSD